MIKKIIISRLNNIAAIIHNSKIQELIINRDKYHINDIYVGIVQKIFTSINAAFLKLNYSERSGFIHVSDTKYLYNLKYSHLNNISEVLSIKQKILVQIIKEPTTTKGPRLTTNIHLSGQYVILMPLNNTICIGQNIYDENERSFLRALGILVKPFGMGILFKKNSVGVEEKILINDIRNLGRKWNFIEKSAIEATCPKLIYHDNDIVQKVLKNHFDASITLFITDSKSFLKQIYEYLINHNIKVTDDNISIQLYKNNTCILEKFEINSIIFSMLEPKVELESGIHIFIESSEALTTIDVNSGSFNKNGKINDSVLHTNCLAANEIGYQIKIRNINGIIIIDFIDMKSHQDQLALLEHLNKVLFYDEAKPEIVQLSELGLVELTRRRRGQSIKEIFKEADQYSLHSTIKNQDHLTDNTRVRNIHYKPEINSIFFKRQFKHYYDINVNHFTDSKFISLQHQHMIPLDMYYSTIDQTIGYN